ncbi:MAG: dTDP-4-dehydrorhamnose reductase [Thermoanaerobacter sp.]|nr:dTDP-4-dehydrorhamnose reductase [Thermoanaerobacter sp.]
MAKRVLVTGAAGMLGRAVVAEFRKRGDEVLALSRQDLDITDLTAVRRVLWQACPHVVVNCAAFTDVDGAEASRERAFLVNGLGAKNLALACRDVDASLVHISTDYIFDGRKGEPYKIYDTPNPLGNYGKSKLWGERAVAEVLGGSHYIVRTSWLFGFGGKNFVETMLKIGREKGAVKVVNDQRGCPTYTVDLAQAMADLVESGRYGTYHVTNSGVTTWHEFALTIFKLAGLAVDVSPCSTGEFPRPARRPPYSVLDPFPLKETIGYLLPPWEDALKRYLKERSRP